jgi:hypothetical protein
MISFSSLLVLILSSILFVHHLCMHTEEQFFIYNNSITCSLCQYLIWNPPLWAFCAFSPSSLTSPLFSHIYPNFKGVLGHKTYKCKQPILPTSLPLTSTHFPSLPLTSPHFPSLPLTSPHLPSLPLPPLTFSHFPNSHFHSLSLSLSHFHSLSLSLPLTFSLSYFLSWQWHRGTCGTSHGVATSVALP